ncbi:glycosyltransferase family 2 protein [Caproiciproducens faecalis]|uniref:4,4'-diaponeurosporenoate glycosyltransferase n=1 Tax=Caproiciproducens faecalis TaxID=2820301 RepID=A0ABS7DQR6_9FIRM|nr:glycosyltransferase [Caproiciproducens faecalis]MBW7573643.1 glycosyltransferase [Caproiciproducens faecalis]
MQITKLSIIVPVRNVEQEISGVLRSIAAQAAGLEAEFIVVDMGSADRTVWEAVQLIKELKLRGFVIQNGDGTVAAALNTGIQKSGGDYLTFIFARRLYRDFISGYLETAARTSADFVFGSISEEESHAAERRLISRAIRQESGAQYLKSILNDAIHIDISAIMLRRKFLLDRQIYFFDSCSHGYAEEFVFRCLLSAETIAQSPTIIKRDTVYELKRGKQKSIGKNIFQHTDAMLRIFDMIKAARRDDAELIQLFEHQKLPLTVMNGIDVMLKEGAGYNAVRGYLRVAGYDKLLSTGRQTDKALKRRITVWRTIPWMYKAK